MDLKSILIPERIVQFDFPGCSGLKFELAFLSRETNQQILKRCEETKFDSKSRKPYTELNQDKFLDEYVRATVKGWSGFKFKYIPKFLLIDLSSFNEEDEMEYSHENALTLMKNSTVFDTWVSEVLSDLENFTGSQSTQKLTKSKDTLKKVAQT